MKLPVDEETGRRYVSITQFRTYGATEHSVAGYEDVPGCPRQYKARYVDRSVPPQRISPALERGLVIHRALQYMEDNDTGPEEALKAVWTTPLSLDLWAESVAILNGYLDKGGPMTRYGTLGTEVRLWSPLTEDDEGPVWFLCVLDWLGVELDDPSMLHVVDYKSSAHPPEAAAVRGDVQLMGQAWAVRQNLAQWGLEDATVVVHLDALRWRDIPASWTAEQLDQWQDWAAATAGAMLADTEAKPRLNSGCSYCPVASDCPVILDLPKVGREIGERELGGTYAERWAWRVKADQARKVLEFQIKVTDALLAEAAHAAGRLEFADQVWEVVPDWGYEIDLERLHDLLGDARFYDLVKVTKTGLEEFARTMLASDAATVRSCISRVPKGTKIQKGRAE